MAERLVWTAAGPLQHSPLVQQRRQAVVLPVRPRRLWAREAAAPQWPMAAAAVAAAVKDGAPGRSAGVVTDRRRVPSPTSTSQQCRQPPSPALQAELHRVCKETLSNGRPEAAAQALRRYYDITGLGLEDVALCCELISALAAQAKAEQATSTLLLLAPKLKVFLAAVRAFGSKGRARGVAAVMEVARSWQLLQGPDSRPLWLACIKEQGRMARTEAAVRTFKEMRRAKVFEITDTPAANIFLHAIHHDVKLTFIRCRQLLDEGLRPDTSTLNVLLKACMRARDSRRMELALRWVQPWAVEADEITYATMIKAHSYSGQFERVLEVQKLMSAAGFDVTPEIWGSLIVACGAAGEMEMAAILWWEMRQQLPSERLSLDLFHAMMTACTDNHQGERALSVFREAQALGLAPQARTYNIALKACEPSPGSALRKEQLLVALSLYREMQEAGVAPDTYTYATLIELCAQARQGHCALELHRELRRRGLKENVVLLTSLIKACGAAGMVDECMAIFQRIVWGPARTRPNRALFRTLIQALRENGELGEALRVYEGMRQVGFAPNDAEFQELLQAAAEVALTREDGDLQAQVASLCKVSSPRMVDLHGMSTQEARAAVLCVLALVQQRFRETGTVSHDMTIITGRGEHSEGGEAVLRSAIIRLLEDELRLRPLRLEESVAATCSRDGLQPSAAEGGSNSQHAYNEQQHQHELHLRGSSSLGSGLVEENDNPGRVVVPQKVLLQHCREKTLRLLRPCGSCDGTAACSGDDSSVALPPGSAAGVNSAI